MSASDVIRERFRQVCGTQDAACICEAIAEVAAQLADQNAIAERVASESKRINDHCIDRDGSVTLKIKGHQKMLGALLFASLRLRELGEGHAIIADAIRFAQGDEEGEL